MTGKSLREEEFLAAWRELSGGLGPPVREHRFHAVRRWRFDFAFPRALVAVEIEGGTFGGKSRHTTGVGHRADCEKYNAAAVAGWKVLRFTSPDIRQRPAHCVELVLQALGAIQEGDR